MTDTDTGRLLRKLKRYGVNFTYKTAGCHQRNDGEWVKWSDIEAVLPLLDQPQQELNAWRELGEEMARVISLMPKETFEDWFPDWFGPRLFDIQVRVLEQPPQKENDK